MNNVVAEHVAIHHWVESSHVAVARIAMRHAVAAHHIKPDTPLVVQFNPIETDDSGEIDTEADSPVPNTGDAIGGLGAYITPPDNNFIFSGSSSYLNVNPDGTVIVTNGPGLINYLATGATISMQVTVSDQGLSDSSTLTLGWKKDWLTDPSNISVAASDGSNYTPATAADLINLLGTLSASGLTITNMNIKGHGGPDGIQVGPNGEFLTTTDQGNIYIGGTDVTAPLKAVTDGNTTISLVGCFSYPLAKRVKADLGNGAQVYGAVRFVISIPGTAHGFGLFQ